MSFDEDTAGPVCGVSFGRASFTVTGLRYEREVAGEYWDDNWVVIRTEATGDAGTFTEESTLHSSDMLHFRQALAALISGDEDAVKLDPMEPGLQITIERAAQGFQFRGTTRESSETAALVSIHLQRDEVVAFAAQWSHMCDVFAERTPNPDDSPSDEAPQQYAGPS